MSKVPINPFDGDDVVLQHLVDHGSFVPSYGWYHGALNFVLNEVVERLEKRGLVEKISNGYVITEPGRKYLNSKGSEFE